MYVTPEQFTDANKARVDALITIAHAQFAGFERLSALNFSASRSVFEDGVNQLKALLSVKDTQGLMSLTAASTQPTLEKAIGYSRSVYELAIQTQVEMTQLAEAQAAEMNRTVVSLLDQLTETAPAGSEFGVAAVKSAMAATNAAYESLAKIVKQSTDMAEPSVAAATTATVMKKSGTRKLA